MDGFKVGDVIRIKRDRCSNYTIKPGQRFKIEEFENVGDTDIRVARIQEIDGETNGRLCMEDLGSDFELVLEPEKGWI